MNDVQCPHCGRWVSVSSFNGSICPACRSFFRPAEGSCRTALAPPPPPNWHPVLATAVKPREIRRGFAGWFKRQCDNHGTLSFGCQMIIVIWTPLAIAIAAAVGVVDAMERPGPFLEKGIVFYLMSLLLESLVDVPAGIVAIVTNHGWQRRRPPPGLR